VSSRPVTAVIFDLDGTLIDSAPDIANAINRHLSEHGWERVGTELVAELIGHGSRRLITDVLSHIGHPVDTASVDRVHAAYQANYAERPVVDTRFFPHVAEDLVALTEAGLWLGVCTNKPHALTGQVLAALGIDGLVRAFAGADAVPACKPAPGHLLAVADQMRLTTGEWVYVGDTDVDRSTARSAGVPFFAVPWGGGGELDVPQGMRLSRLADLLDRISGSFAGPG